MVKGRIAFGVIVLRQYRVAVTDDLDKLGRYLAGGLASTIVTDSLPIDSDRLPWCLAIAARFELADQFVTITQINQAGEEPKGWYFHDNNAVPVSRCSVTAGLDEGNQFYI